MNTDPFIATRAAPAPLPSPKDEPGAEVDILGVLNTVKRGKWSIIACMIAMCALGIAWYTSIAVPKYVASTVITLENRDEQVLSFDSVVSGLGDDLRAMNTEVQVIQARNLIKKLVVKLDLTSDPEFNRFLPRKESWFKEHIVSNVKAGIRLFLPRPESPPPSERRVMDETVNKVIEAITISTFQYSLVFQVTVQTEDPEKSALISDTLAELYVLDQLVLKSEANERATAWLAERVSTLEAELEDSENAVKDFNAAAEVVSEEALALRNRQLKDFRTRKTDLTTAQAALDQRVTNLRNARASGPTAMVLAADDPGLSALEGRLAAGGAAAKATFDTRYNAIQQRAELERDRNAEQLRTIEKSIVELDAEVEKKSSELLELTQLQRVAEANRLIYEYFLGRLKEISVQEGIQQADSRVISAAVIPEHPSSPRLLHTLAISFFMGLIMGIALVVLREMRTKTFRIPEDLEAQTGLRVIGEIARTRSTKRKRLMKEITFQSNSQLVEAVRNLRTSIMLSSVGGPPQIVMLTSSVPGEGKTTLSLALTHSMASMKKKVLLIEGDIRRRTLRDYFPDAHEKGLISAVNGETPLEQAVYSSEELGADILMGEGTNVNAADFFTSDRFEKLLDRARKNYDFIVIDTPPVLAVPDARVIGPMADALLYVVHWDSTTQRQVRQGLHAFATINLSITGLVLSQINYRRQKSYGYGDGYGAYAKGYYKT